MLIQNLLLLTCGALLIFCFRNLYASPSRFNLAVGRTAIIMFAGLAAWSFWSVQHSRTALTSAFYELPTDVPGVRTLTLQKPPALRGYRARLVRKDSRQPAAQEMVEKSRECRWEIPGKAPAFYEPTRTDHGWDSTLFDMDTDAPSLELRYTVNGQTRSLLEQLLLEVTASSDQTNALLIGASYAQGFMVVCLLAMLFAAFGVLTQRRRLRQEQAASVPSAPPAPDVS